MFRRTYIEFLEQGELNWGKELWINYFDYIYNDLHKTIILVLQKDAMWLWVKSVKFPSCSITWTLNKPYVVVNMK
jgi:hypothetical protein